MRHGASRSPAAQPLHTAGSAGSLPEPLERLRRALGRAPGRRLLGGRWMFQAAVAVTLRERAGRLEVLLIQRAQRQGDPWSGHMAFPGGRVEPSDPSRQAAAVRETREEVGLELAPPLAHPLGRLSELLARGHGRPLPMRITPFVYGLAAGAAASSLPMTLDPAEVASAVWVPLDFLADPAQRDTMRWRPPGKRGPVFTLPCYRYEGHLIWGLTLEMLDELLHVTHGRPYRRRFRQLRRFYRLVLRGSWRRAQRARPGGERGHR